MLYTMDKLIFFMEKVHKRIKELKNKFKLSKVKQVLNVSKVISYLNFLQKQYVMYSVDKPASNIAFICKKFQLLQ